MLIIEFIFFIQNNMLSDNIFTAKFIVIYFILFLFLSSAELVLKQTVDKLRSFFLGLGNYPGNTAGSFILIKCYDCEIC